MKKGAYDFINELETGIKNNVTCFVMEKIFTYVSIQESNNVRIVTFSYDYKVIYEIYNYFIKKGYNVSYIEIDLIDSEKEKRESFSDIDYRYLDRINNYIKNNNLKTEFQVIYTDSQIANYDDFTSLVECIRWYRSLILGNDLSPLEKLTYAYDICKTIQYKKSGNTNDDIDNDNTLHLFVKTGNIVCLGYNRLLKEILYGIDDNISFCEFMTECYYEQEDSGIEIHSRGFVKLDDDKYNVHGFYILDVTWDSVDDTLKEIYGKNYDSLSGYRYFLVPITKYRRFFKGDTFPRLFYDSLYRKEKYLTVSKLNRLINSKNTNNKVLDLEDCTIGFEFESLVDGKITYKDFLRYLNCKRPDLDTFVDALIMVRRAEGYDIQSFDKSLVYGINPNDKDGSTTFDIQEDIKKLLL